MVKFTAMEFYCLEKDKSATFSCILHSILETKSKIQRRERKMATTDKKEGLKASGTCMVVQNEKISTKNGESPADNIVRGSNISILTSHAGLNPRSKPGNESSFAGELSKTELEQILENPFIEHIECQS